MRGEEPVSHKPLTHEFLGDTSQGRSMKKRILVTSALLLSTALSGFWGAFPASASARVDIVQPNHQYAGKTYGEWSAEWWKWAAAVPAPSPVNDPKANCAVHQRGPVWFLATPFSDGTTIPLRCDVPAGKAILVPVINAEWSTVEGGCGGTYRSLLTCAAAPMDRVTERTISIDGRAVNLGPDPQNQSRFRVQSPPPPFGITFVDTNGFGVTRGTGHAVADGFYVLIQPPDPGRHTIEIHATVDFGGGSTAQIDTVFTLKIQAS